MPLIICGRFDAVPLPAQDSNHRFHGRAWKGPELRVTG